LLYLLALEASTPSEPRLEFKSKAFQPVVEHFV